MRFLKYVKLNNYLNLKHAKLNGLRDLNIIIGPNNCGKTSLLKAVDLLGRIKLGGGPYGCTICRSVPRKITNFSSGVGCEINVREKYLTKKKVSAIFGFYKSEFEKGLPDLSVLDDGAREHFRSEFRKRKLLMKEKTNRILSSEHVSPVIQSEIQMRIFNHILFCPDERLQTYKGVAIPEHIKSKNFGTLENRNLIDFLRQVVDVKISDLRQSLDLVKDVEKQRFTTPIAEQGSGVKSLICLVVDIISATETKILLVDEPELGLNPSGKHAFLKFLIEQSRDKQVFLATHDPTFVNPILWNRENVSVYMYSMVNDDFVKVNLMQSKQDPSTFAGFLPHTTSLKQVHIYVEGTTDVYIFQMFLDKYVKEKFKENWYHILSKIGIFHLAGDFWRHLLYTIPKRPYTSIVVLDGDKKEIAKEVVDKYGVIEMDRFRIFDSLDEIIHEKRRRKPIIPMPCPVYCLKNPEIEDYLETRYEAKPLFKEDGPSVAYEMKHIPPEIEQLFDTIFQMANIRNE